MTDLNLRFNQVQKIDSAKVGLALFTRAAETFALEPFTSESLTEAERILNLADDVGRASWAAKQEKPYARIASQLVTGDLDAAQAVTRITDAEHLARMNEGIHTPAERLAINVRAAAAPHVLNQDESKVLDWLTPALDQAAADASAHADVVDSIVGTEPQRDRPGVRSVYHHWEPRHNQLRSNRKLARSWDDLGAALADVYQLAAIVHEMRALGIIRRPLTDTRETVWSQVWETIPEGAFTGDTRPGRIREFYRCNRHQHRLGLPTAAELDRQAGELPHDENTIMDATAAMHDRMANAGYQSVFP